MKSGTTKLQMASASQKGQRQRQEREPHEAVLKVVALRLSFNPFLVSLLYYSKPGASRGEELWEKQAHTGGVFGGTS